MIINHREIQKRTKPILGGHETFAFRNGWLKKGADAVRTNPNVFLQDDALVTLGVGKNMVRSIKHWCLSTGIIEEIETSGRSYILQGTPFGEDLISDQGWDPYLEKQGSLWLLHWKVATNRIRSLIWAIAFSDYLDIEFSKPSLTSFVLKQLDRVGIKTTREMINRELDCFFHTYVTTRTSLKQKSKSFGLSEDSLDCPLAELDLIRYLPEYDLYHFNIGPKNSLPLEVFAYSLLLFLDSRINKRSTIALEECVYQPDSPGQVFKLDENSVMDYLLDLEQRTGGSIRLIETAGISQIYLHESITNDLQTKAKEILQSYYE